MACTYTMFIRDSRGMGEIILVLNTRKHFEWISSQVLSLEIILIQNSESKHLHLILALISLGEFSYISPRSEQWEIFKIILVVRKKLIF